MTHQDNLNQAILGIASKKASTDSSQSHHLAKMGTRYSGRGSSHYQYTFPNEQNQLTVPGYVAVNPAANLISQYLAKLIKPKKKTEINKETDEVDPSINIYNKSRQIVADLGIENRKLDRAIGNPLTPDEAEFAKQINIIDAAKKSKEMEVSSIEKANESTTESHMNNILKNKIKNQCYKVLSEYFVLLKEQGGGGMGNQGGAGGDLSGGALEEKGPRKQRGGQGGQGGQGQGGQGQGGQGNQGGDNGVTNARVRGNGVPENKNPAVPDTKKPTPRNENPAVPETKKPTPRNDNPAVPETELDHLNPQDLNQKQEKYWDSDSKKWKFVTPGAIRIAPGAIPPPPGDIPPPSNQKPTIMPGTRKSTTQTPVSSNQKSTTQTPSPNNGNMSDGPPLAGFNSDGSPIRDFRPNALWDPWSDFVNSSGSQVANFVAGAVTNPNVRRLASKIPVVRNIYPLINVLGTATPLATAATRAIDTGANRAVGKEIGILDPLAATIADVAAFAGGGALANVPASNEIRRQEMAQRVRAHSQQVLAHSQQVLAQQQLISRLPPNTFIRPIPPVTPVTPIPQPSLVGQLWKGAHAGVGSKGTNLVARFPKISGGGAIVGGAVGYQQGLELQSGYQSDEDRNTLIKTLGPNWRNLSYEVHPSGYINQKIVDLFGSETGTELRAIPVLSQGTDFLADYSGDVGTHSRPLRPLGNSMEAQMRRVGAIK